MNDASDAVLNATSLDTCADPIFVIGSPRSGTSVVSWALAHHNQLWTSTETDLLFRLFGDGKALDAFRGLRSQASNFADQNDVGRSEYLSYVAQGVNALYTSRSGGRRWIDQAPVNTLMVSALSEMFPQASFVHVLRDGRRVVHSMINFGKRFGPGGSDGAGGALPNWATGFRQACVTWRMFVERASKFADAHRARVITVVNEELAADPKGGFEEIFRFLGVPTRDGPVDFFKTSRINSSFLPFAWKTTTNDAPGRPETARPWVGWTDEQRGIFLDEAGLALVRAGFVRAEDLPGCLGP